MSCLLGCLCLADASQACQSLRLRLREFPRPIFLIAVAFVAILLSLPSVASAQRVIPHAFLGSATINGSPAADGTVVAALVDGRQIAAKSVSDGSYPVLLVEPDGDSFSGKTVTFTIGGFAASETAFWIQGEVTELNLNASPAQRTPTPTPRATAAPIPTPVLLAGEQGDPGPRGSQGPQGVQGHLQDLREWAALRAQRAPPDLLELPARPVLKASPGQRVTSAITAVRYSGFWRSCSAYSRFWAPLAACCGVGWLNKRQPQRLGRII